MSWLHGLAHRARTVLFPGAHARELDEEIRFHLELDAMHQHDRDAARRRFGNRTYYAEEVRRMTWIRVLDVTRQNLRDAWRGIAGSPAMTGLIVLTLALGIGVNMAMFGFLDVVFLRPPASVERPDQVRRVWTEYQFVSGAQYWSGFDYAEFAAVTAALDGRVPTTIYREPADSRLQIDDQELRARRSFVSATFFELLGVRPAVGRFFTAEEDQLGAGANVAVVSHAFWQRQFGGDASALGRELRIASRPYTIIGVAAPGFAGVELDATDVWVPLATQPSNPARPWWTNPNVNGFQILLRNDGAMGDEALTERVAVALRSPEARQRRNPADTASVVRLGSIIRARGPGNEAQEIKIATRLAGVTVLVLLIACANVINLLLARAVRRRREVAVRLAMGISRVRLGALLLTETLMLALLATAAAVIAASWGGALLRGLLLPDIQWAESASPLHWRVVALGVATGIAAGLIAGIVPAMQSMKTELTGALKAGVTDGQARSSRVRSALVVVQAALSVVLLVGAGLFLSSLSNVRAVRTGYDARQIVFGGIQYDTRDSVRDARQPQLFREVAERLRSLPGVEAVALARMAPTRGFSTAIFVPDVDTTQYPALRRATYNLVSPEYFAATGMRLLRGEGFPREGSGTMSPVVLVNEAMAREQWPGMDVLGRCMRFPPDEVCYRVVGVVETAMFDKLLEEPQPQYYLPLDNPPSDVGSWFSSLVVKAQPGAREAVIAQVQLALRDAFPGGRPTVNTFQEFLEPQYRPWRLGATLFTAFGLLALVVAVLGSYSTVSYAVAQRTHEFGVRIALGARLGDVLRLVLGEGLRTVAIGVALGVVLALAAARLVAALLYGVAPHDPLVLVLVATLLLAVGAIAAIVPAWRAARVDPVTALRAE